MVSVVITAAGIGKRMRSDRPKQYISVKGVPLLAYTIEKFEKCADIEEIVIVCGSDDKEYVKRDIVNKYGFKKVNAITEGGSERQYSVYNGIKCVNENADVIMIHDGVRPLIKEEIISRIIEETRIYGCCVPGVPVKDTIKRCSNDGIVVETPKRETLWAAQTPQSFKGEIIRNVHQKAAKEGFLGTDDSMLAEKYGYKVKMVYSDYENIKITTPEDIYLAEDIISKPPKIARSNN